MTISSFAPHNYLSTREAWYIYINWEQNSAKSIGIQKGSDEGTMGTIESKYIEPSSNINIKIFY